MINQILIIGGAALAVLLILALIFLFSVSRKSQKVMESLLLLLTRPERAKIQDAARVLQTVLSGEMEKIESNFREMQETLATQIAAAETLKNDLGARNAALVGTADEAAKKINIMTQRLENTADGFRQIVASGEWDEAQKSCERFTNRINELLRQIDNISTDALEKTGVLQNQIDGWIESGKTLHNQLQSDCESNSAQMNSMSDESESMRQKLIDLSASVADGFANVKKEAAGYEAAMSENDKLLGNQIEKLDAFTKQSKTLLTNQMNILTNTANVVGGQIRLSESAIEKQVRKLIEAAETTMETAAGTEASVRNVSTELSGLTGRFHGEIKEFASGIVSELNTVTGVANTTLENTKTAAGAFSESVRAMATGVRETLIEMNEAHTH
ncbi:MAG: hypothetical protein LBJ18_03800, partial [Rickettsiales bacterium]|nr:hypothetical protein [Rickettsiales bacterium]